MAVMAESPAARLPARLRARRKALGLSQEAAAKRVGVTLRTWQRWEAGTSGGNLAHLADMAEALETTPEELLGTGEPGSPRSLEDLTMEARLKQIEQTQEAILDALQGLRSTLADPREVLREADKLLGEGPPPPED